MLRRIDKPQHPTQLESSATPLREPTTSPLKKKTVFIQNQEKLCVVKLWTTQHKQYNCLQGVWGKKIYLSLVLRGILLIYSRMWFISDAISIQTRPAQPFKRGKIRRNSVCKRPNEIQYTKWRVNKNMYNNMNNLTCDFFYTSCSI